MQLHISVPSTRVYAMKQLAARVDFTRGIDFSTLDSGLRDETLNYVTTRPMLLCISVPSTRVYAMKLQR